VPRRAADISPAYLKPGFAFGGSCLPKDLRALMHRATRRDLSLPLLGSVLSSNHEHLARAVDRVLQYPAQRVGIFGLTFKEQTDDLRESPAVALIEQLVGKGREVRIFDPYIRLEKIYGSNRNFVLSAVPHIARLMARDLSELLSWAECVVMTQRPAADMTARIDESGISVLNLLETSAPAAALAAA
jgi:GDP-mannose 6-dehydrogenase